jgi:uncharacterized protein (TIGR02466 family)
MPPTSTIEMLFVTRLYRTELGRPKLISELDALCRSLAVDDIAGRRWSQRNLYLGYTSYASLNDLPWRFPAFARLTKVLDRHVKAFGRALDLDLQDRGLTLDSLWVNVIPPGGHHGAHIHPHAAVSGTLYIAVPKGASALKLEDPRLPLMMAAPPKRTRAARSNRTFVSIAPSPGTLLLWESFVRHEVPLNMAEEDRISISFNYAWK